MDRRCRLTGKSFRISDEDLAFYDRVSPVFGGVKYTIPPPTLCPEMRLMRRMAHANQIYVYTRPSSVSGKHIFSAFDEAVPFPVVENEYWWGPDHDGREIGVDYNFKEKFFKQFHSLGNRAAHQARFVLNMENSDYCNNSSVIKNCYFVFNTSGAEDCYYCENAWNSNDCIDCTHTKDSELCYDCVMCMNCYNLQSSQDCENCSDSYYLLNCRACKNCFGCVNLRQKEYHIFNKACTKAEYQAFISDLDFSSFHTRQELARQCREYWLRHPRPHSVQRFSENVTGNYILESRNVVDSFQIRSGEDCRYCFNLDEGAKDCYDYLSFGRNAELVYETARSGINIFNLRFCLHCANNCSELLYCAFCFNCQNCFGCVGLNKKQYCVFNKQYSKSDYEQLVPKIIEKMHESSEWGEFFPIELSAVAYNHSHAQRYFPKTEEEVRSAGLRWCDREVLADNVIDASRLPDTLPASDDSIVAKSSRSGNAFRITSKEIALLRRLGAPLPRLTYDERMNARALKLGSVQLFKRRCSRSGEPLLSSFSPDSPWIIWDRDLYEAEFSS